MFPLNTQTTATCHRLIKPDRFKIGHLLQRDFGNSAAATFECDIMSISVRVVLMTHFLNPAFSTAVQARKQLKRLDGKHELNFNYKSCHQEVHHSLAQLMLRTM
eukprot:4943667-Amphidinium_carterae.1